MEIAPIYTIPDTIYIYTQNEQQNTIINLSSK